MSRSRPICRASSRARASTDRRSRCASSSSTPAACLSTPISLPEGAISSKSRITTRSRGIYWTRLWASRRPLNRGRSGSTPTRTMWCWGCLLSGCLSGRWVSRSMSASSRSWGCPTPTSRPRGRRRFVVLTLRATTSTVRASWRILPRWIRLGRGRPGRWSRPPVSSTPSSRPSSTEGC